MCEVSVAGGEAALVAGLGGKNHLYSEYCAVSHTFNYWLNPNIIFSLLRSQIEKSFSTRKIVSAKNIV